MRAGTEYGKYALLCISVCVALALAEAGLRFVYRSPWYMQLLSEQGRGERLPYRLNSLGLRDRDYPVAKPPGTRRVLLLGDSFTFGIGVLDDDSIMPALLEKRPVNGKNQPVEILNGGIPGSLTKDWLSLLSRAYRAFHPDLIVAVFFLRDGTRTSSMGSFFDPIRNDIAQRNNASRLYRYSYVYRVYRDMRDRRFIGQHYANAIKASYRGGDAKPTEWDLAKHNLLEMREFAAARGVRFGLAVYPILTNLRKGEPYPFQDVCDTVDSFAQHNAIPVHDMLNDFRGAEASALWVSPFNQHPNAKGHRIAANALRPFILQLLSQPGVARTRRSTRSPEGTQ